MRQRVEQLSRELKEASDKKETAQQNAAANNGPL
jgi:hypothetical protein